MKKILFYNDSKQTGGHEIMAIEAIKALISVYEVHIIISSYNDDLFNRLTSISNLHIHRLCYFSNRFQIVRNFFSFKARAKIKSLIKSICPDLVIGIQGTIDSSFLIFSISRKNQIKTVSYIPIVFDLRKVSKSKFIGRIKDVIHGYYYSSPDVFITITEVLAERLKHKSNKKNVFVVKNGIDFSKYIRYNREENRAKYNISNNEYVIGYIGRLEFWHKGLDFYIDFLSQNAQKFPNIIFLFVGKGEAADKIEDVKVKNKNIRLIPWTKNVSEIYSLMDCSILPSRFEGCPLTMIEALYFDLPIIASNIPELSCFIPHENLFDIGNYEHIYNRVQESVLGKLKPTPLLYTDFSVQSFSDNFFTCVTDILENDVKKHT